MLHFNQVQKKNVLSLGLRYHSKDPLGFFCLIYFIFSFFYSGSYFAFENFT